MREKGLSFLGRGRSLGGITALWALASVAVACGGEFEALDLGQHTQAVTNGQPTTSYPHVGILESAVYSPDTGAVGMDICTATLVGTRTLLTAAHCVTPGAAHTFWLNNRAYAVASVHRHPHFSRDSEIWPRLVNDIALAMLVEDPSPNIVRIPLGSSSLRPGDAIVIVGYGATGENLIDTGEKRAARAIVGEVRQTLFVIPPGEQMGNLCGGDSGGPSFAAVSGTEVQVGVHSGKIGRCGNGGINTRVDAYQDWLVQQAAAVGGDVLRQPVSAAAHSTTVTGGSLSDASGGVIGGCRIAPLGEGSSFPLWFLLTLIGTATRGHRRRRSNRATS